MPTPPAPWPSTWMLSSAGTAKLAPPPCMPAACSMHRHKPTPSPCAKAAPPPRPKRQRKAALRHPPSPWGCSMAKARHCPCSCRATDVGTEHTLVLHQEEQAWTFTGITSQPAPSLLRSLSAPVLLDYPFTEAELLTLLAHDSDAFNRWEAAQRLSLRIATNAIAATAETATEKRAKPCQSPAAERGGCSASGAGAPATRCRLQRAGADPALRKLHRRAAGQRRSPAHPQRARSHAPATGPGPASRSGKPPTKPTPTPALTSPNPSPQAAAPWPDWR